MLDYLAAQQKHRRGAATLIYCQQFLYRFHGN
jgi:hypothetical protein